MANVISNLGSWSTTPSSNEPNAGSDTSSVREDLQTIQAVVRKYLATATTLAAGATTDLSTAAGNLVTLTGTATTINSFGTVSAGLTYYIISNAAHTVTYNATSMKLPGGASITLASGDVLEMTSEGSGNWKCVGFQPFAGYQPLDADLTAIAALTTTSYGRSLLTVADEAALKTLINAEAGVDFQAYDAELAALAGLTSAANKIPMFSGSGSATLIDFKDQDGMDDNSDTAVPSQQSVKAYVDAHGGSLTLGTVETGSQSIYEWTSIPSGTNRVTINIAETPLSTAFLHCQLGDSGGYETSNYANQVGTVSSSASNANYTSDSKFTFTAGTVSATSSWGTIVLTKLNGNTWSMHGCIAKSDGSSIGEMHISTGTKTLSGELDRLKVYLSSGNINGTANILYE